ncbi:MAG: hypothetical protein JSV05_02005 [Candidatus Bathyarchaeota archaeon]|nr:MAG: hypothetical protein JSV05_02005 [Candidatus Bathyarchaeota archaeon]
MDKIENRREDEFRVRTLLPRFFKALFKTGIVYLLFVVFSAFIAPFQGLYNYQVVLTGFFALYVVFIFILELTRGTIFHYIFSIANSLIVIFYLTGILNTGKINFTIEQFNIMVDIRFFLAIFVLGSILGLAKSMLSLLNWLNEREEQWLKTRLNSL